jgi:anthranilate synthase component 1
MKHIKFKTKYLRTLSDTVTPVELYLKIRDKYPHSFLLESSDYNSRENCFSYLCLNPVASFIVKKDFTEITFPDRHKKLKTQDISLTEELFQFCSSFEAESIPTDFITNGVFGYTSYNAIPLFENIKFSDNDFSFPLVQYHVFRHLIVFNHFNNEMYVIENLTEGEVSTLDELMDIISRRAINKFRFQTIGKETSSFTDDEFLSVINKGIRHCYRGDVFQVVLSRRFRHKFRGDEFNVYRALRHINPSPYLFYFDYGNFILFGSSPEAQLRIKNRKAVVRPIAGTFRRSENQMENKQIAFKLTQDPKESAEHVMLVDLARNDLSKNSHNVTVEKFKETEFYSHVIHLVSEVSSDLGEKYNPVQVFADTFPAGTLSGAPKYRAMQIIDENEKESRGFYGGAVGYFGFSGECNHSIFIRSFLSYQNELVYQAGCGVVAKSVPENELQEVNNKISALRKAIEMAQQI